MRPISVFAPFNGVGGTMLALDELKVPVKILFSAEIDKFANIGANLLFPKTLQMGDIIMVRRALCWKTETLKLFFASSYISDTTKKAMSVAMAMRGSFIDIIMAGFPCQAWSLAGKQGGKSDPRGALVHELIKIWHKLREINPNLAFMFENVAMKQEFMNYINDLFSTKSVLINSSLLTAQSRKRNYWANWPITQPKDLGIFLRDIIEFEVDAKYEISSVMKAGFARKIERRKGDGSGYERLTLMDLDSKTPTITARYFKGSLSDPYVRIRPCKMRPKKEFTSLCHHVADATDIKGNESIKRVYGIDGKAPTLTTMGGGHREPKILVTSTGRNGKGQRVLRGSSDKSPTITARYYKGVQSDGAPFVYSGDKKKGDVFDFKADKEDYRKLTPRECFRLQGFPEWAIEILINSSLSNTQLYKMCGNGWTHPVIVHNLQCLLNAGWREFLSETKSLTLKT